MEIYRSLLCPDCNNAIKIQNGDFLFTYNIECPNGHKKSNIDLDILLQKRKPKQNLFKCKNHRRKIQIHCFTCNEDICNLCHNDIHKNHEVEYFKNLTLDSRGRYDNEYNLNKLKEIVQIFLTDLNYFQSKINLYIDNYKSQIKKQYEFRTELINNIIGNNISYIDIENFKIHSVSETYKKMDKNINKFISKVTFMEKYDCLRGLYEEIIKKQKYIEEKKIINRINDYINLNLIPLNNNLFLQLKKNFIANISQITIFKENKKCNSNKYNYEPIISKSLPFIINKGPILIDNNIIKDECSFYCISNNSAIKMTVLNNDKDENKMDEENDDKNCIINIINVDKIRALVNLSEFKNIVFDSDGKILLYNDLFKDEKLIGKTNRTYNIVDTTLKINDHLFVYTLKNDLKINPIIYSMNIIDEDNVEIEEIKTNELTPMPLFYIKDKKILLSLCYKYKYNNIKENNYYCICLINFAIDYPEIIQMININYYEISKKILYFNCFNDESFYFPISQPTYKNEMFYNVIYISQYKLIKGELTEVSRIKKEDDLYLKRFNSYGS